MKKVVALVLAVTFSIVGSVLPILAGEGPVPASEPAAAPAAPMTISGGSGWTMKGGAGEKNPRTAAIMSGLLPCTGQWYNGELLTWKSAAMAAIEGGSIFVLAFFAAGGAGDDAKMVCMAGAGGMIANHAWSAWDAWRSAKRISGLALEMDKNRTMVSYNIQFEPRLFSYGCI
ncbi:MAG: hypothetical protein P8123_00950 [bacterium]